MVGLPETMRRAKQGRWEDSLVAALVLGWADGGRGISSLTGSRRCAIASRQLPFILHDFSIMHQ